MPGRFQSSMPDSARKRNCVSHNPSPTARRLPIFSETAMTYSGRFLPVLLSFAAFIGSVSSTSAQDEKITYADHVLPIFRARCLACHNPDKKSGGLDLTNFTAVGQGGSSGAVVEAGDLSNSYLWLLVNHESQPFMPPNSDKLPEAELAVLKKWIEGGTLETKSSKVTVKKKNTVEFSLSFAPNGRPEGPPPMPSRLSLEPVVTTQTTTAVSSLATSPWAPLLAVSGQRQVLLYHTQTLELLGAMPFPEGIPNVLRFSRSGQLLMAAGGKGGASGRVVVFNVKTGERVFELGDELDAVLGADISGDHRFVALGGPSKLVRIYSAETGEMLFQQKKHTDWVTSVSFSPDGVLVATGDRNGGVFVWEAETGREYLALRGHTGAITGFAWRKDSNVLASVSEDSTVKLWELENGGNIKNWGAHGGGTSGVWFTREDQIATVGRDRTAKLWDQNGGNIRSFEAFNDLALQVTFCDETKRVIAGDWTGLIRVWEAADGKRVGEFVANPPKLEQRIALATAEVTRLTAEHKAQSDAYNAVATVAAKVLADLEAAKKRMAELTEKDKTLAAALVAAQQTATDAKAKQDAAAKVVTALQNVVPALKESLVKAEAAAAGATGDQELVNAVNQFKAITTARETAYNTAAKTAADEAARLTGAQQTAATTEKQLAETKAAAGEAAKQIEALTAALTAEQQKVAAAKTALDAGTAALAAAQSAVQKWQEEIAFSQKLNMLQTRQAEADQVEARLAEVDAVLKEAQGKVAQAQTLVAQAQQTEKAAMDEYTASQQNLTKVTGEKDALAKDIAAREVAAPMLKEAADKTAAASAAVTGDAQLAAAATAAKATFDKNAELIAAGKAKVAELDKAVLAAQESVKALEQKVAVTKAAVAEATKKMEAEVAAMKPVEEQFTKAKAVHDQAQSALNAVKSEVDTIRQQASAATAAPATKG